MRKILEILIKRGFIITLSIFAQIAIWIIIFTVFSEYQEIITIAMMSISFLCILHVVVKDTYPENKIPWIVFIFVAPVAGGIFYIVFGNVRMRKRVKKIKEKVDENLWKIVDEIPEPDYQYMVHKDAFKRQVKYLRDMAKAPAFQNTSVKYLKIGEEMLEAMVEELKKAKKFIFIESFIIEEGKMWNEIHEILAQKAKQGVKVRVLYDDVGCIMTLPLNYAKKLREENIECVVFNEIKQFTNSSFNNRDHRKICVIDGNVGFNGGINLADEYINHKLKHGHWKDTAIKITGDAVYGLTLIFLSMWNAQTGIIEDYEKYAPTLKSESDGIIQPFADSPMDKEYIGENIYMSILSTAKDYVYITSPYLIITGEMATSLICAAKSGIDVRLILPGIGDKKFVHFLSRSYYQKLVESGVKIYEYTPGFIHAKMFVSDDDTAIVGTINLDYRSLNLHYECGTIMYNCSEIHKIKEDFLLTLSKCEEITMNKIKKDNKFDPIRFIILGILRTFSPLM